VKEEDIQRLSALLDERTMALMERESDLADRMEEIEAQKEELTAAVEELHEKNKSLQAALDELKERNHELDQILYRASHDLRSPVSSIMGVLGVLEYEAATDGQKECFDHIYDRAVQMDELLTSLSSLSKTISNEVHFSTFNLELCLRQCVNQLRHLANFPSVVIRIESTGLEDVTTDQLLFSIVIRNLLKNSITFRDAATEGSVIVRAEASQPGFMVEVIDDGQGIPDDIKENVFNMFYRGSELSAGSGLGLYIVKKIVKRLNGQIRFSSEPQSTTFRIELPNQDGRADQGK
jgi:signal transduction histidine kinase